MKRFLIFMVLIVLATSLIFVGISCKEETTTEEATTEEATTEEATEEESTLTTITDEPITIYMTCLSSVTATKWGLWLDMYSELHPNVTFERSDYDWPYLQEIAPSMLANPSEDVDFLWWYCGEPNHDWANDGLLKNLDDLFEIYGWEDRKIEAAKNNVTPDMGYYFVADGATSAPNFYYNQTILDEVGVALPTTIDELFEIAPAIKAAGYDVLTDGWYDFSYITNMLMLRVMGPEEYRKASHWIKDPNKSAETAEIFRSQGTIDAFTLLKRFYDEGIFAEGNMGMDWNAAERHFVSGKSAFYCQGDWEVNILKGIAEELNPEGFDMHVTSFPAMTEGGNRNFLSTCSNGVVVPSYIPDEKLAILGDLFNMILEKDWAQYTYLNEGIMAVNKGWTEEELADLVRPEYVEFLSDFSEFGDSQILLANQRQIVQEKWNILGELVIIGELTPEEAAQELYDVTVNNME